MDFLTYIFWPRPPATGYDNPKIIVLLVLGAAFIVASFVIKRWRRQQTNAVTKKLARGWPRACNWFGIIALLLTVARAEDISYLSMRFLWVLWLGALSLYVFLQYKIFKVRHYEKLPEEAVVDPRQKYLPNKNR